MDIHKPKPIHSWREFLKEYAIIVLGVLTALSLEQGVEHWREHRQYLEARDAMRAELVSDMASLGKRDVISACGRKRLAEIAVMLDQAEKHQPFRPPSWIGEASSARIRFAAETEAGRSSLFSPGEQRQFGRLYGFLHSIDLEQDRERQVWARLRMLEGRTDLLPEMVANLREALAQARYEDERIMFLLGFVKNTATQLSLTVTPIDTGAWPDAWPACLPLDTPSAEGVRRSAYHMDHLFGADGSR